MHSFRSVLMSLSVATLSMLSVPSCQTQSPKAGNVDCAGESRVRLNCDSEFRYDVLNLKGGFQALGFGTQLATETTALRQIDSETERYAAQARRLCEEYIGCVINKDTYATRSENLRRRMAKVPELYDGVQHAAGPTARAKAVAAAYESLVPDDQRTELQLDFAVMARRPSDANAVAIRPGTSLPTGTQVSFMVRTTRAAHVYLFQRSPDGFINVLFPDSRIGISNPLPAGQALRIPSGEEWYRLNDRDIGEEKVFVGASLQPIQSLQQAANQVSGGQGKVAVLDTLSGMPLGNQGSKCATRALELDIANVSGCVRSRGLELDSAGASSDSSLRMHTEAADSTIVGVFNFQHTK